MKKALFGFVATVVVTGATLLANATTPMPGAGKTTCPNRPDCVCPLQKAGAAPAAACDPVACPQKGSCPLMQ